MHIGINDLAKAQDVVNAQWKKLNDYQADPNEPVPAGYYLDPNAPENKLKISNSAHPVVCIGTVLFKGLAIFYFLLYTELMETNLILAALNVGVFVLLDFWYTKEFAGRILLGLEWYIDWAGDSRQSWHFNSDNTEFNTHRMDRVCFWYSQYIAVLYWGVMGVGSVIGFNLLQSVITLVAFLITVTNLFNFYKCSKEEQYKVRHLGDKGIVGKIERAGIEAATHLVPQDRGLNPFGALNKYPGDEFNHHGQPEKM